MTIENLQAISGVTQNIEEVIRLAHEQGISYPTLLCIINRIEGNLIVKAQGEWYLGGVK